MFVEMMSVGMRMQVNVPGLFMAVLVAMPADV